VEEDDHSATRSRTLISSAVSTDLDDTVVELTVSVDVIDELLQLSIVFVDVVVVVVEARKAHFKLKGSVLIDLVFVFVPPIGQSSENARFLGDSETLVPGKIEDGGPDSGDKISAGRESGDLCERKI